VADSRLTTFLREHARPTGLIPFITAGYPSLDASLEMLAGLAASGAAAIEIGVPFSDPIADGPDIQRASEWALRGGVGIREIFGLVRDFRRGSNVPVVLMTYANPVLRWGAEAFARDAAAAGVEGVLVSDLPPEESPELWRAFDAAGVDTVMLVAPTTSPARAALVAKRSRGFLYCLARTGVTGGSAGESAPLPERLAALRPLTRLPLAVGFGIGNAEQARSLRGVADALVVGAAFMRRVTEQPERGAPGRVLALARELIAALNGEGVGGAPAPHPPSLES
jgi:tryptophan synthase alpha chain